MIIYKKDSNLFDSTAKYIVNPVNTRGVSDAGLALEFKKRFPDNYNYYSNYCKVSSPEGGDLIWYLPKAEDIVKGSRDIINFCTKEDYNKKPSKLAWIEKGIKKIIAIFDEKYAFEKYPAPLLALPLLGCGKGGLEIYKVLGVFTTEFANCKYDVEVYL